MSRAWHGSSARQGRRATRQDAAESLPCKLTEPVTGPAQAQQGACAAPARACGATRARPGRGRAVVGWGAAGHNRAGAAPAGARGARRARRSAAGPPWPPCRACPAAHRRIRARCPARPARGAAPTSVDALHPDPTPNRPPRCASHCCAPLDAQGGARRCLRTAPLCNGQCTLGTRRALARLHTSALQAHCKQCLSAHRPGRAQSSRQQSL